MPLAGHFRDVSCPPCAQGLTNIPSAMYLQESHPEPLHARVELLLQYPGDPVELCDLTISLIRS